MPKYYVETGLGCGLREGKNKAAVERDELRKVGTHLGVQAIRLATQEDIDWVHFMGGEG